MDREEVQKIICEIFNCYDDMDSLGFLECICAVEDKLNIRFEPEIVAQMETVNDVKGEAIRLLSFSELI